MRFVGALETLLDPIVGVLDALPAHFSADHAPRDVLDLLAGWLGVELDESQTPAQRREMVRHAAELGRAGAAHVAGIELALTLAFPDLPLRVEDLGGVPRRRPTARSTAPAATFIVYCDKPIAEETQAAVARCIEQYKPVHTTYRLRVKAPKKKAEGEQDEDLPELRAREPARPRLLRVRRVPALGADGFMQAVPASDGRGGRAASRPRPSRRRRAAARRPPPPAAAPPPAAGAPAPRRRPPGGRAAAARRGTAVHGAAPPPAAPPAPAPRSRSPRRRRSRCACPTRTPSRARRSPSACDPGERARVLGARPQPGGHRRQLPAHRRRACRDEWWSVLPDTVYLVPFGSRRHVRAGGRDPPAPAARAGGRGADLGARRSSRTPRRTSRVAASEPLALGIQPFEEHATKVKPERASGRRKANFKVASATRRTRPSSSPSTRPRPTTTAASGSTPAAAEIAPGETVDDDAARQAAEADLDRPAARAPDRGGDARPARRPRRSRRRPPRSRTTRTAAAGAACAASASPASTARGCTSRRSPSRTSTSVRAGSTSRSRWSAARRCGAAGARHEPQPQQPEDAGRAGRRRRSPARCCRRRPSSARSRGCRGGWRSSSRCSRCSRCCSSSSCPRASRCPTSSARRRRSRPSRRSPRPSCGSRPATKEEVDPKVAAGHGDRARRPRPARAPRRATR